MVPEIYFFWGYPEYPPRALHTVKKPGPNGFKYTIVSLVYRISLGLKVSENKTGQKILSNRPINSCHEKHKTKHSNYCLDLKKFGWK